MRWQAEPSSFAPGDLAGTYAGRGFAMPLAQALGEGLRLGTEVLPAASPTVGGGSLVIGGAGFLGARIVAALLGDARCGTVTVASRRPQGVKGQWSDAFGPDRADALMSDPRLRLVAVDLAEPDAADLILSGMAGHPVSTVYHLAAQVHAFSGWEGLRAANLDGTTVAARVAARLGAMLQLASTLSVFVSSNGAGEGTEAPLAPNEATLLFGGYAQTKAAAEAVLAGAPGLPSQTLRYGLLVPEDGALLAPDHFLRGFVEGLRALRAVPDRAEEALVDLTPVGEAARAAIAVATSGGTGVHHYANPVSARLSDIVGAVDTALRPLRQGTGLRVIPAPEWKASLRSLPRMQAAILSAAFDKRGFLEGAARKGPLLNADLFQSTGRSFGIARSLATGAPSPTPPAAQITRLVTPLVS